MISSKGTAGVLEAHSKHMNAINNSKEFTVCRVVLLLRFIQHAIPRADRPHWRVVRLGLRMYTSRFNFVGVHV